MAISTEPVQRRVTSASQAAGQVVALWRYPVKSMQGEELNSAAITGRGLVGDRAYALVDRATAKVASAKSPRKWGRLFDCRASYTQPPEDADALPPVRITLPDGTNVASNSEGTDETLSRALGREVRLTQTPPEKASLEEYWPDIDGLTHRETTTDEVLALAAPGTFFDLAPIHLLTTATLDRLRQVYPDGRFEVRRFRPNIVVAPPAGVAGFVENEWVGRRLCIGAVVLHVIIPCPRCVMTTLAQGDLPADSGILRAVAQHNRVHIAPANQEMPSVGVYAAVIESGVVRRGDSVLLP